MNESLILESPLKQEKFSVYKDENNRENIKCNNQW